MHNKCNVLESSPKLPPTPRSLEKLSSMKLVPGAKKFGDHSFMSPPSFQRFPGVSRHTKLLFPTAGPLVHSSPWSRVEGSRPPNSGSCGWGPPSCVTSSVFFSLCCSLPLALKGAAFDNRIFKKENASKYRDDKRRNPHRGTRR